MPLLTNKLPKNMGPLRWDIVRIKTDFPNTTFSTPESLEALLSYLEDYPLPPSANLNTPLFRDRDGKRLRQRAFSERFKRLSNKCGFPVVNGYVYFRSHNLRKWFGNQLKKTDLGYDDTRRLRGHLVGDRTERAYLKTDPER